MKKTFAAAGAAALGISGAVVGSAAPAAAAPVEEWCENATEQTPSSTAYDNWFMDCIPQYGAGKIEFVLTSETDLPDDLEPFSFGGTSTSSAASGGAAYYGSASTIAGFTSLSALEETPTTRRYSGTMLFPVASVGAHPVDQLPVQCVGTYTSAWIVHYLPTTTTFVQTLDGVEYRWDVTAAPEPLVIALNLNGGAYDPAAPVCVTSGGHTISAASNADPNWSVITEQHIDTVNPWSEIDASVIGEFPRYVPPPEPVLPVTGVDPRAGVGLVSGLIAAGLGLLATVGLRRRRAASTR